MTRGSDIDVLVAGGGAFGLWTALACLRRGLRVAIADPGRIGAAGASLTPTGALAPHQPGRPTALKTLQAQFDPRTARLDAPRLLAALRAACEARGARMLDGAALLNLAPGPEGFALSTGPLRAGRLALATGAAAFAAAGLPGGPEHGQAARLALRAPPGAPLIMGRGLWIVPHADGTVGVGATAEKGRADLGLDAQLESVIDRARALCPVLREAPVLSRWAGLRPRAASRDPVVGPLPDRPHVIVVGGGQRIGLALAPACGEAAAAFLAEAPPPDWPDAFLPSAHLAARAPA